MSADSFDQEWAAARADVHQRTAMRLDQADPGGGGGGGADLAVSRNHLGAIGHAAFALHGRLAKDGNHAASLTTEASGDLTKNAFLTGSALATVHKTWDAQLRTLLDACAQISNHLDYSAAAHAKDDEDIRAALSVSKLNEYLT
ncbi:hypothetical protein [Streptomyces roseicoloratus]|uniref:hypothetical protein n=1 Tax=Streptomyces roseicoloratus TaxID=2508722 RepID=UPI00319DFEEC